MAAVSYGHVAIVPKGVWSAEVQYEPCNLVEYNGSSYVAKLQPPIGTLPTDTQYWQVSAVGAKKATSDSLGLVEPDNKTTEVDETGVLSVKESTDIIKKSDGTLSLNTTFEEATELANIIAGEAIKEVLGKVSKSIAATMNLDQNALLKNMLSGEDVDDASKIPTSAFVHTLYNRIGMGTDLSAGDATNLTQAVNDLNSNINDKIYYLRPHETKTWTLRAPSFLMIGASNTTAALLYVLSDSFKVLSELSTTDLSTLISVSNYRVTITNPLNWGINVIMLYA